MNKAKDLQHLAEIAQLMLDHKLARLRSAAADVERSRKQLTAINAAAQPSEALDPLTSEKVAIAYDRWADVRRSELNLVIARQTATWLEARTDAQSAFGRVQALGSLATRQRERR